MKGNIVLNVPPRTGIFRIGPSGLGTRQAGLAWTSWDLSGTIIINGFCSLGRGCSIAVQKNGTLVFGSGFVCTGSSDIICVNNIEFGDNCLLSWDIIIMDTDFHKITKDHITINQPKPIKIGTHVWIGCRCTILKGVSIADNIVVAANSTITTKLDHSFSCYGRNGVELKSNIE